MIITLPNEMLRQKSKPVPPDMVLGSQIKKLMRRMRREVKIAGGVGLAAVQIGELWRVILIETDGKFSAFINPKIVKKSWKKISIEEGCLSVPGVNGYVKRSAWVKISALDEGGKKLELKTEGLTAIIFQHEIDHTNGILFIDKITK